MYANTTDMNSVVIKIFKIFVLTRKSKLKRIKRDNKRTDITKVH